MKKNYIYVYTLFLLISCVEQIDIEKFSYENFLVVEASITDEFKYNIIKLQRTIPLDSNTYKAESNAIVSIIENDKTIYSFTETADGIYTSEIQFKAELESTYKINIKTQNNEEYLSNPQKIEGINNINEVTTKIETDRFGTEGVSIIVNSITSNKDAKYYKFTYQETYKIVAPLWSPDKLTVISSEKPFNVRIDPNPDSVNSKICFKTINSTDIIQSQTNNLDNNNISLPIRFIKKENFIISRRYSILVNQYVQSYEGYTYYKTLSKLSSSNSVFTSNQPGFIQGNIFHINDIEKKVIGFFEVNSVSKKRIFFNHIEMFPNHNINFKKDCDITAPTLYEFKSPYSPLLDELHEGRLYYKKNLNDTTGLLKGLYLLVDKKCGDCRESGTNIKPTFWVD